MKTIKKNLFNLFSNYIFQTVCVVFACIITFCFKINFHEDEIMSFGLSNHQYSNTVHPEIVEGQLYDHQNPVFQKYITVESGHQFDYSNVIVNQEHDVHPPLYYIALHTICSFFPGEFSPWFGLFVNLLALTITILFLRKTCAILFPHSKVAVFFPILICLTPAILNIHVFIRMYALVLSCFMGLTYWSLKNFSNKIDLLQYLYLTIIIAISVLTHYASIIFVFFSGLFFIITNLILTRSWRNTILYCLSVAISACIVLLVYPHSIKHLILNENYQINRSTNNLFYSGLDIIEFYQLINRDLFNGLLTYIIVIIISLLVIYRCLERFRSFTNLHIPFIALLLGGPAFCYFLIVSRISPLGYIPRYNLPIYPIILLFFYFCLFLLVQNILKKNEKWCLTFIICFTIFSFHQFNWYYLFKETQSSLDYAKSHNKQLCVCVYDTTPVTFMTLFNEYSYFENIYFVHKNNFKYFFDTYNWNDKDTLSIYYSNVFNTVTESDFSSILQNAGFEKNDYINIQLKYSTLVEYIR